MLRKKKFEKIYNLNIYALDALLSYKISYLFVYAMKYAKHVKKNEIHNPGPSKIIFESDGHIYKMIFTDIMIISDIEGNINLFSNNFVDQINEKSPYYTTAELKKARSIKAIYGIKGIPYLSPKEIIEYNWSQMIVATSAARTIKTPYAVGGGL